MEAEEVGAVDAELDMDEDAMDEDDVQDAFDADDLDEDLDDRDDVALRP
jgi:hypothetical protein